MRAHLSIQPSPLENKLLSKYVIIRVVYKEKVHLKHYPIKTLKLLCQERMLHKLTWISLTKFRNSSAKRKIQRSYKYQMMMNLKTFMMMRRIHTEKYTHKNYCHLASAKNFVKSWNIRLKKIDRCSNLAIKEEEREAVSPEFRQLLQKKEKKTLIIMQVRTWFYCLLTHDL